MTLRDLFQVIFERKKKEMEEAKKQQESPENKEEKQDPNGKISLRDILLWEEKQNDKERERTSYIHV